MERAKHQDRGAGGKLSTRSFILAVALTCAACGGQQASLTYENGEIRAAGWSGPAPADGWESVFAVRAGDDPAAPAMLGEYVENGGVITFNPRFPPSPGVTLHVTFSPPNGPKVEGAFGEPAKVIVATTKVAQLYPTADEWPENTLKMYLEFSGPMASGEAYDHIRVVDAQGREIIDPFVEIEQELWDASGKRLTVLFDPGRIKRGLLDNRESGPPLMAGRPVTIEVDPAWRDANGAPLADGFLKAIKVAPAVREMVHVKHWRIDPPKAPDGELVVTFDRPMDHALARRAISVTKNSSPIAGEISLAKNETEWRFTPAAAWASGGYALAVEGVLEDLAGNRPGKMFDVDTADPAQSTEATAVTIVPFTISVH